MNKILINRYLEEWDNSISDTYYQYLQQSDSRRTFLKKLALGVTAVAFSESIMANTLLVKDGVWKTFEILHLHLFPIEKNTPNARTINATAYLKSVIEWPGVDNDDKKFLLDGIGWLNGVSNKLFKNEFVSLGNNQREEVLRLIEQSKAGESWLSLVLLYLIESLLTDPIYGGNTKGVGWKWLEHQAGFPQPSKSKRYFSL